MFVVIPIGPLYFVVYKNKTHIDGRIVTDHNRFLVYVRVQRSRINKKLTRKHKTHNTETQVFNMEKPKREKPRRSTNPRKQNQYDEGEYNKILGGNDLETFFV